MIKPTPIRYRSGGVLPQALLTLVLMTLSFILGFVVGKERSQPEKGALESATLEEILKQELAGATSALVRKEGELLQKIVTDKLPVQLGGTPQDSAYSLQLASFKNRNAAEQLQKELLGKNLPATVSAVELPGKGLWYRVQVGKYQSQKEAERAARELSKKTGKTALIFRTGP